MLPGSGQQNYLVGVVVLVGLLVRGRLVMIEALASCPIILVALPVQGMAGGGAGRSLWGVAV